MDTYFALMFKIFSYGTLALGALLLVLLVFALIIYTTSQIVTSGKYWKLVGYAIAFRMHKARKARKYWWDALDEIAAADPVEARQIVDRAMKHVQPNG